MNEKTNEILKYAWIILFATFIFIAWKSLLFYQNQVAWVKTNPCATYCPSLKYQCTFYNAQPGSFNLESNKKYANLTFGEMQSVYDTLKNINYSNIKK